MINDSQAVGAPSIESTVGEQNDYCSGTLTNLTLEKLFVAAIFFIKFDRKQNTRLWPFVFTGVTRSPPYFS
jgi:hypothetical protein